MSSDVRVAHKKLADYIQNPDNPVAHTPRNLGVVVNSINKVGAFRSGAASKGKILAGNLTWEAMAEAGIEDVVEVTTDGKTWVIVNREDLTPEQERDAAYYDQRGAELADWDAEQVLADLDAGVDLSGLFGKSEMDRILAVEPDYDELWQGMPEFEQNELKPYKTLVIHFGSQEAMEDFQALIGQSFTKKTKYIWHPKQIQEKYGEVE